MYTTKRDYLNNLTNRYTHVYDILWWDYIVIDLCAWDGGISKYYKKYYWCDIEPISQNVDKVADDLFVKRQFPLGEKILTVFWYWGRAGLLNLDNKNIYDSELVNESSTLDESIQEMLPYVKYFVLEWTSTYVNGYIKKYWFQWTIIDTIHTTNESRVLDRIMYIIDVSNLWGNIQKIPAWG